ncbi:hypothetical protein NDU88_011046 [Pleurodeles waltl]|uniref:Uncharacterized protein n=1 Tax=Pleurodeles waltl TaxID=8319 RepID=A0AAV7S2D8_PLEWA|nr:hypothetical protein NDU88_011046 [Pleurodeles waltl]
MTVRTECSGGHRGLKPSRQDPGAEGMGRLRSETGTKQSAPKTGALDSDGHKLDAVLAAVERIGTSLDQAPTSLESKINKVASDLTLLHADHCKLA